MYKLILLVLGLGFFQSCSNSSKPTYFYEPSIGWKIQLPDYFSFENPNEFKLTENVYTRKNQKIRKTPGESIQLFKNKVYSTDLYRANLAYIGNSENSSLFPIYKNLIYGTMEEEEDKGLKLDSVTDQVMIDNQKFDRFTVSLKDKNLSAQYIIYHTKRKDFDLLVEMQSTDKNTLEEYKKSILSSQFDN